MASWGYFFAGIAFCTIAAFGLIMTFLTFTPVFSTLMNAFAGVVSTFGLTTPYNTLTFIAQGNTIYMGSFDFVMIGLAMIMFFTAFVNEPNESRTENFTNF